jgi:tripartite-type tricarboxylate transporter receptor subunit TctC
MPGAVGLQAANWLATQAPRDGTVLHMIMQNMSAHQALGGHGVEFDTRRFFWIGNTTDSPNVINSWHTTGVRTIEEVKTKELIVGAPGTATASVYYPKVMNALVGTRFKIVSGYPGGNDVNLAMERGEVGGRGANSWASWKSTRPQWIAENKIHILVQIGLKRHPDLPNVPLLTELAANEEDRQVLAFISAETGITRAVVTTPDVPPERVEALRRAFDATMKDPEFLADAQRIKITVNPMSGEDLEKLVAEIADLKPALLEKVRAAYVLKK